jgi:zinc protease
MTKQSLKIFAFSLGMTLLATWSCKTGEKGAVSKNNNKTNAADSTEPSGLDRLNNISGIGGQTKTVEEQQSGLDAALPFDPNVRTGQLPNGMRYYIRQNSKPEKRIELRLAVNAGSMQEEDNQRGLAHFVEHMAFNGTKNFEKNELVSFLELTGVRFGADLNAYTSFDETVYMLQLPTDKEGLVDKGLIVMSDWATGVTFEGSEIDKERGVIESEWRTRLGAGERMREKYWPKIFHQSRYADRLPIGTMDVIRNAPHERLRTFYKDWYRPNLMALVVVGDLNVDEMERKIQERFSKLENPANPRPKELYAVPDHKETLIGIATDKEATSVDIEVIYKHKPSTIKTLDHYRDYLARSLYAQMFNERLRELGQKPSSPFLNAYAQYGSFVRAKDAYFLSVSPKEDKIEEAFKTLLTEQARVLQHGFTDTELERQKQALLKRIEKRFNEKDKTQSGNLAMECVQHFLQDDPMFGIERELALVKEFLPKIRLEDINQLAAKWLTEENRSLILTAPEKPGLKIPTEAELLKWISEFKTIKTEAYKDQFLDIPLVDDKKINGSKITNETKINDNNLNVTQLQLANGVRIVIKPTNFQNNQILLNAYSPGGTSLYSDKDYFSAAFAADIVDNAGVGQFDLIALQKKLSGKDLSVSPYIQELYEGFSGRSSVEDLETLLQLIYLYGTQPRKDKEAFETFMNQMREQMKNAEANPQQYFFAEYSKLMSNNNIRRKNLLSEEELQQINLDRAMEIYQERFADFSDFTFVLVGNIDLEKHKALLEKYLGGLPNKKRVENWKDLNIQAPKEGKNVELKKGLAPQSFVILSHVEDEAWTAEKSMQFSAMVEVLEIMVRENLREDKGGVYSPFVGGGFSRLPRPQHQVIVFFQCAPDNVNTLVAAVKEEFEKLQKNGPSDENVAKVKETFRRQRETELENNRFWLGSLTDYYQNNRALKEIYDFDGLIEKITKESVQKTAKTLLKPEKLKILSVNPEKVEKP